MFQASGRKVLGGVLAATLLLGSGGCSSSRSNAKVDESWMARVPTSDMEDVRQAQVVVNTAEENLTRAKVAHQDSKEELKVAKEREKITNQQQKVAQKALELGNTTDRSQDVTRAQNELQQAEENMTAARAETEWKEKAVTTRESMVKMREREVDVAKAQLNQARYRTLERNGDARAEKLDSGKVNDEVAKARAEATKEQDRVNMNVKLERQAEARWKQADTKARSYGGSGR
ncbi:hypothetical protein [Myxococcus landrumensis]|uniref:Lipoprotein n=1 Tax=Myxococcus landrumensis TaxID=2813577 RepID=A0ABX7MXZ3_9BACT|nr:hypothetical protein [Myxococcus landrumus]QSQ11307.1 hypothetical protein JY572_23140 [Myxococcus landrumus]